jgi:hypothetical protein
MMATVRFSKVIQVVGKPFVHLLWMDPAKDSALQKAIKADRVMTVHQQPGETKADYGTVGFEKGALGEILVFPKPLKQFSNQRVIGIKYDLIEWPAVPKSQQAPRVSPPAPKKSKSRDVAMPALRATPPVIDEDASARVVKFPIPEAENANAENENLDEFKNQVRHAMKLLQEGKQVAAFNILKQITEN